MRGATKATCHDLGFLPWPWATYVLQPLEQVTAFVAPPGATPEKSFVAVPGVQRAPGGSAAGGWEREAPAFSCRKHHAVSMSYLILSP